MEISLNDFLFAFGLTLFAGLSTSVGAAIAFFAKHTNTKLLTGSLGFSAGVMIYISLVEIFFKAKNELTEATSPATGYWLTIVGFFAGMGIIALIDKLVPEYENPHEMRPLEETADSIDLPVHRDSKGQLYRMGMFAALAIAIHNFPEGLATFTGALKDPSLGISIAIAIAIHNIPEGIAVSVPIYYATASRKKAFFYSSLSGLSEPVGALVGYLLLMPFMNEVVFGLLFSSVAGIMVFISLDELLPAAEKYGEHHVSMYGVVTGMIVMAVSLALFA
ncbi:Zinc transporter ZupT [Limihaloglobus sulfuriphilus]|uniref:Zinc transporter ZupT n=1 Tax=Limihaloglobus sulfuriphilus TaxID=1851148 RepID=A0A1Q2MD23_9BACT|nr:zinc transporter ZupT [Limihaloglobus sulfuriphilus]AQQ70591.1 Zinc transporter ZupT [Limihaloglobus sulfuriphilus]